MTNSIITPDLVDLSLEADSRHDATRQLARLLAGHGRVTDLDGFLADVAAREAQMPTGIEGGIGIPHARSAYVTEPSLAFARSKAGVDYGAADGPAHLIFLIAAPEGGGSAPAAPCVSTVMACPAAAAACSIDSAAM